MSVAITYFPKVCHLHKQAMTWEEDSRPGWKCPRCTLTCPKHGDPMRSGIGMLEPVRVLYCRRCRVVQIKTATKPSRDALQEQLKTQWHTMEDLSHAPGVAHIWRTP